jgi:NAD(P)-dependent dehydrogenase (short-subunit alcohol dehydrogenase family)
MRLRDKVIIVTGGSRGIGRACATRCAKEGAKVTVNYSLNAAAANEVVNAITSLGGKAIAVQADVSARKEVENMVNRTLDEFGSITGLINNAGIAPFVDFLAVDEETWDRTMAVNTKGVFLVTQCVARAMIASGCSGRICNVTSISGEKATSPLQVPYCTSKGAANMFTKVAALALSKYNITVNAILPGTIETDINREVLSRDDARRSVELATPLKRLGDVDDIAHATVYLMSEESRWVTGSLLVIDGGYIA